MMLLCLLHKTGGLAVPAAAFGSCTALARNTTHHARHFISKSPFIVPQFQSSVGANESGFHGVTQRRVLVLYHHKITQSHLFACIEYSALAPGCLANTFGISCPYLSKMVVYCSTVIARAHTHQLDHQVLRTTTTRSLNAASRATRHIMSPIEPGYRQF